MLGVLGGMGPLATADFFRKLIDATPAATDADHIPVLIDSVPQVPSRPAAILADGASPLPALLEGRNRLLAGGATVLAMPCNTAHHWYDALARDCSVPFLHIVDAVADLLPASADGIGVVATRATLRARIYERRLPQTAGGLVSPSEEEYERAVQPAIDAVKRSATGEAGRMIEPVIARLLDGRASVIVLACTELPIALDAVASPLRARCIDSTEALARACVKWWKRG